MQISPLQLEWKRRQLFQLMIQVIRDETCLHCCRCRLNHSDYTMNARMIVFGATKCSINCTLCANSFISLLKPSERIDDKEINNIMSHSFCCLKGVTADITVSLWRRVWSALCVLALVFVTMHDSNDDWSSLSSHSISVDRDLRRLWEGRSGTYRRWHMLFTCVLYITFFVYVSLTQLSMSPFFLLFALIWSSSYCRAYTCERNTFNRFNRERKQWKGYWDSYTL